jgi:hypothetical protein
MSFDFTDETLKQAVIKADWYEINAIPSDDQIEHTFTIRFQWKMNKLIRLSKKTHVIHTRWNRRTFVACLLIIILSLASAMSVSAVRRQVFEFISEIFEKYSEIHYEKSDEESNQSQTSKDTFVVQIPEYIPDGFELFLEDMEGIVRLDYEKGDDFISYEQIRLEQVAMQINTEGVELEDLIFHDLPAKYYSNQGVQNLIWYDNSYQFMVSATLDRDTVFKIADSIKIK